MLSPNILSLNWLIYLSWRICFSKYLAKRISWDERRNEKSWNFCRIYYIGMTDMNRKANEENGGETLVDSDGILWLNEKHIDHKHFQVITVKYHSGCGKHRYGVLHEPEKQPISFYTKRISTQRNHKL